MLKLIQLNYFCQFFGTDDTTWACFNLGKLPMFFSFKEGFQYTMALSLYFLTAKNFDIFVLYLSVYLEMYLNQELKS